MRLVLRVRAAKALSRIPLHPCVEQTCHCKCKAEAAERQVVAAAARRAAAAAAAAEAEAREGGVVAAPGLNPSPSRGARGLLGQPFTASHFHTLISNHVSTVL